MNKTVERPKVAKPRKRTTTTTPVKLSVAEQELKTMKAYIKKVTSSPEDSRALLQRAGIIDEKGGLTEPYRS
jgi:hypothetical protein